MLKLTTMDTFTEHAILLGRYQAWMRYAIDALKGNTSLTGADLAKYLEQRIEETELEIKNNQYGNFNNVKGNEEIAESNAEAVAG